MTGVDIEPLVRQGFQRYAAAPETMTELARAAAQRVAGRGWERDEDQAIAARIGLAVAAAQTLAPRAGHARTGAQRVVDRGEPGDRALSEHLHARLAPEVRVAVALRATCGTPRRFAADALLLSARELRRVEDIARADAEDLVLPYHDEFICEPADLAGLASSASVTAAVSGHLARCRSCRHEFAERVGHVLALSGVLSLPLPPFATSTSGVRPGMRRALAGHRRRRRERSGGGGEL
jgi:hypothetical protein